MLSDAPAFLESRDAGSSAESGCGVKDPEKRDIQAASVTTYILRGCSRVRNLKTRRLAFEWQSLTKSIRHVSLPRELLLSIVDRKIGRIFRINKNAKVLQ